VKDCFVYLIPDLPIFLKQWYHQFRERLFCLFNILLCKCLIVLTNKKTTYIVHMLYSASHWYTTASLCYFLLAYFNC